MPRSRGARTKRSAAEWSVRALLAGLVAVLGYVSITHTLASVIADSNPERAHILAPEDGQIAALLASKLLGADPTPAQRKRSERLAQLALRYDATAVSAVATLGLHAQLRGDTRAARHLFAYAQSLSRRNLQTQIWAIEDAVGRGDVRSALRHYDVALRTSREASDLLFPVLTSAIADAAIRAALIEIFVSKPSWGEAFIDYVAKNGPDPRSVASLFLGLRRAGVPISQWANAATINGLIAGNFWEESWRYYASLHPGVDRRVSRDASFTANATDPSPFDWVPIHDTGITTSIQRGDKGGVFDFAAPASLGGVLLQQVQLLSPGSYRIEGHSLNIDQPDSSRPYWVLSCQNGRELGRVVMPNSAQANGTFAGRFTVPAGCPIQTLALVARPSDAVSGVSGQIDQLRLYPLH